VETEFTWDAEKAKRNLRKHGSSFETAKQVILEDCGFAGEVRTQVIGHTPAGQLLLVFWVISSVPLGEDPQVLVGPGLPPCLGSACGPRTVMKIKVG
jgi:hypothetical protein